MESCRVVVDQTASAVPETVRSTIYFSSGTGNSYRVAVWFRDACVERAIPATLVPVNLADPAGEITPSPGQLLALAFPTHGGLPPWSVLKFLLRMPRRRGARFLCLPTRGSFLVGPVLVPGAAVLASFLPALLLLCKGYRPVGAASFDMPINCTSVHPPLTAGQAARIAARARRKFDRHVARFFRTGALWLTRNNLYEALWSLVLLYFVPLFFVLYLILARLFMGKILFATARCTGCGVCADSCPAGALVLQGTELRRPFWRHSCEHCLRCLNFCARQAIAVSLPWAALLWWLGVTAAAAVRIFAALAQLVPWLESVRGYWTVELANSAVYYPVFVVTYFFFYWLGRSKPVNVLLSRTSFNFYLGQYRAPDTALKDLTAPAVTTPAA